MEVPKYRRRIQYLTSLHAKDLPAKQRNSFTYKTRSTAKPHLHNHDKTEKQKIYHESNECCRNKKLPN